MGIHDTFPSSRNRCSPPDCRVLTDHPYSSKNKFKMSHQKGDKDVGEAPKSHRIRITLTSRKVQSLEKVSTRKTPCGEGSKTWDTFELRIHKRLIDLNAPTEAVKSVIVNIEAGVEVEVTIAA